MEENKQTIEDKAKFFLSLHYGKKQECIEDLSLKIEKYRLAPQTPKVLARIEEYKNVIITLQR